MKDKRFLLLCVAGIAFGSVCATAEATPPDDQIIRYKIRAVPSDPYSETAYTITLHLTADQLDGESVGWQIDEIRFGRKSDHAEWVEDYSVTEQPELWWIDHADHTAPQPAEFEMPPLLEGTAGAVGSAYLDLDYSFVGTNLTPIVPAISAGDVAALDVVLRVAQEPEPEVDEDDEPVEVDNGGDPN